LSPANWNRAVGLAGSGLLDNTIGQSAQTTIALSHLIFRERSTVFSGAQRYAARRMAAASCRPTPNRCGRGIKTFRPSGHYRNEPDRYTCANGQLYFRYDHVTGEAMRHLIPRSD